MLLALLTLGCGPEPVLEPVAEEWPLVDDEAVYALRHEEVMGLAVAVLQDGELIYARGYGEQEPGVPVAAAETLFRLGSMSKMITALSTMAAVDEGWMSLDEDVDPLVEGWTPPQEVLGEGGEPVPLEAPVVITPRLLLGHGSGLTRMRATGTSALPGEAELRAHEGDVDFTWAFAGWQTRPLLSLPGEDFLYSSFGVNLAGAAVEGAVGLPLYDWVQEGVLERFGLDPARLRPEYWWEPLPQKAAPYELRDAGLVRTDAVDYTSAALPGSGFLATATEMAELCGVLLYDMPEPWREEMWTPWVLADGEPTSYGLGIRSWALDDGQRVIGHVGGVVGGSGRLAAVPEQDLCVVVLSNTRYFEAPAVATALLEGML
ncbi:MAG: serine hydrolase [Alphaproteobacteria bacterium]|nr:serine hydrolase [Alphaproteobacteria bacterium]